MGGATWDNNTKTYRVQRRTNFKVGDSVWIKDEKRRLWVTVNKRNLNGERVAAPCFGPFRVLEVQPCDFESKQILRIDGDDALVNGSFFQSFPNESDSKVVPEPEVVPEIVLPKYGRKFREVT